MAALLEALCESAEKVIGLAWAGVGSVGGEGPNTDEEVQEEPQGEAALFRRRLCCLYCMFLLPV